MFDLFNRLRNFDIRKITPAQMVIGVVALVIVLGVLNFVLQLANTLLPFVVIAVLAYFGYQWLSSRQDSTDSASQVMATVEKRETAAAPAQTSRSAAAPVAAEAEAKAEESEVEAARRMQVQPIINPTTGLEEPDISRLVEKEQEMAREAKQVDDDVLSQIEERRRRLLGQQDQE